MTTGFASSASSMLQAWISAGLAALLCFSILAVLRSRGVVTKRPIVFVCIGGLLAAIMTGTAVSLTDRNSSDAGEALEARAVQLTKQRLVPGSPLACLDADLGTAIEAACERTIFSSPSNVAMAISYASAALDLLSSAASRQRDTIASDDVLMFLRRSLKNDPFGVVSHVLAMEGCTAENCKALQIFDEPRNIRQNLVARTFEKKIEQYRVAWTNLPKVLNEQSAGNVIPLGKVRKQINVDLPSASSIPPVSIMEPEPKGTQGSGDVKSAQSVPAWLPTAQPPIARAPNVAMPMQLDPFASTPQKQ
jgi:hypothetical protein